MFIVEQMKTIHRYDSMSFFEIIKRVNRFVVLVKDTEGQYLSHITNTGRLLDLIIPGNQCLRIPPKKPAKTKIRLVGMPISKTKAVPIDPSEQSRSFVNAVKLNLIPWLKKWKIKAMKFSMMNPA